MLEKTAAGLEPCGFHRVVPGAVKSLRSARHLRTSFWRHGAVDIELTTTWKALMHGTIDLNMSPAPEENGGPALSASTLPLDFLYPSGALTLTRRLNWSSHISSYPGMFPRGRPFLKFPPRLYTPSLPRRRADRSETKAEAEAGADPDPGADAGAGADLEVGTHPEASSDLRAAADSEPGADAEADADTEVRELDNNADPKTSADIEAHGLDSNTDPEAGADPEVHGLDNNAGPETSADTEAGADLEPGADPEPGAVSEAGANLQAHELDGNAAPEGGEDKTLTESISPEDRLHSSALEDLMASVDLENADSVWHHFGALSEPLQTTYTSQVLVFLSKIGRLSDSGKISELFYKLPTSEWDNDNFIAGITAELDLQNFDKALEVFVKGLENEALEVLRLVKALDSLLARFLRHPTPRLLRSLWLHYPEMAARWEFKEITSELRKVASVPDLAERALEFEVRGRQELQGPGDSLLSEEALDMLKKILVRRALVSCTDAQVIPLLNTTNDPLAYEDFLRTVCSRGKYKFGIEIYQTYRNLPGSVPSHAVLHEMFKAYNSRGTPMYIRYAGVEFLWGDWQKFHIIPSLRAYQRYMTFYASRGDIEQVHKLWVEFIEAYKDDPEHPVLGCDDVFSHLLQAHAVRGDCEETQRIFDDITDKFQVTPNTVCWNILLNAYAKAGDYDGAISIFEKFATVGQPDQYTYGTMMQMAGGRGDLGFTIDLYRRGNKAGVGADEAILSSLVDAYCLNDHLQEAQDVCVRASAKGIVATRMWNKLIYYHALRRDLASMNAVLNLMVEKEIPYNEYTYQQLLLGLSLCRQSQHALHLLAVALKDTIFEVTPEHFNIVMGGLLRTGEPGPVFRLHKLMQDYGYPSSSTTLFRLTQALGQWKNLTQIQRSRHTATEWLGEALRSFYRIYGIKERRDITRLPSRTPRHDLLGELLGLSTEKFQFSAMVHMFTQLKDFVRARDFVDLYRYVFQGRSDLEGVLPVGMLNSVMLADFQEGHYDQVKSTWNSLFESAKIEARSADYIEELPHTPKISAKYRYVLSNGLEVMQKLLFLEGNATGIMSLVKEVRDEGFEINSRNWNYYVQALVQLKQYKEAFVTCEKILMPNWTGWFVVRTKENVRNNISLDLRRKGASPRYLRPVATTLYHLARGYMELDQLAPWTGEAAKTAREVENECPQTVRAIKSMIRVHSKLEYEIFGREESFNYIDSENGDDDESLDVEAGDKPDETPEDGATDSQPGDGAMNPPPDV
ncbi:hypothetical protein GGS23DRAFT_407880 [Durotheca rogersii]|uniref:uncharacterized protein n=1 Tax=Durotheca rogersii TaxID=419775 RepID=UPI00222109DE|nr:uncharacterized protein GGS23DRAFT_407880 [Durotheca rogersii]KAI5865082.1 hypothetical protein GGS23DRAFT_407880 [Durotheca rogersii]